MRFRKGFALPVMVGYVVFAVTARGQATNTTNESNNPVTPKTQILLQNYLMPAPYGYEGRTADQELLRLYWPVMIFGVQNIVRIYQPIYTKPLFPNGRNVGLGDTTVFDLALHKVGKFTLGAGPLLVCPSRATAIWAMGNGKPALPGLW